MSDTSFSRAVPSKQGTALRALWVLGDARSGKTAALVDRFTSWVDRGADSRAIFAFAANSELRVSLSQRLQQATKNRVAIAVRTPTSFFQNEVLLYWPLLQAEMGLLARFPLVLKPENEQEIATRLFERELDSGAIALEGYSQARIVRQIVDNLQIAAQAGVPTEDIGDRLVQGRMESSPVPPLMLQQVGEMAQRFRDRCLNQGLLTYGLMTELYGKVLLPHPLYRQQFLQRCKSVLADDVDEYPAVLAETFEWLLAENVPAAFSFNADASVRLGYGADPERLERLARTCEIVSLPESQSCFRDWPAIDLMLSDPATATWGGDEIALQSIAAIEKTTRREMLRAVADMAIAAVSSGEVKASDIAIVGPGLDDIAAYALESWFSAAKIPGLDGKSTGIPVRRLDTSKPLWTIPLVRSLLVLSALAYPNCGGVLTPDDVADMLATASQTAIDPVRAGAIADWCFRPGSDRPSLLSVAARGDSKSSEGQALGVALLGYRLGAKSSQAYEAIVRWVRQQQQQEPLPLPEFFDRAVREFWLESSLSYRDAIAYRALLDAAQRYESVAQRLGQSGSEVAAGFYELLAAGTVTAKPDTTDLERSGIVLGTTYQYRLTHQAHRWQFWLDAGSSLWNAAFSSFGSFRLKNPYLFLSSWQGDAWSADRTQDVLDEQLHRVVRDLLQRCSDRVILCHSEFSISGGEASGPLLPVVECAIAQQP
ncbi:MAG: hypothetical protein AAFX40_06405 [Cyanobacteria bacterium J06639_1]